MYFALLNLLADAPCQCWNLSSEDMISKRSAKYQWDPIALISCESIFYHQKKTALLY